MAPDTSVRPAGLHASLTPAVAAPRADKGMAQTDTEAQIDMLRLRAYRLERVRQELKLRDYAGCVLYDPINVRYATGARNMTVWCLHNAVRYCYIPTEGPVVLFDFHNCGHLSRDLETVQETRDAIAWFYFGAGPHVRERARIWAAEIADLVRRDGAGNRRLALDHCNPAGATALADLGIDVYDGQEVMEQARRIKSAEELACMNHSIAICEAAMAKMQAALRPGMTENELWSILHQVNIANGGEWIETRLLTSGDRTNPWFQECSDRVIRPGDLVSFDTDMIGPLGYCSDISRTFFCGPGKPSDAQRRLYRLAVEQIHHNMEVIRPGMTTLELTEKSWPMPESCKPNRYSVVMHGVGLCDEFPHAVYAEDADRHGIDVPLEPGMTICVESYMGEAGGREGVKLEQQVLITETGVQQLSTYPYDEDLLPREL